jgi:hypothetical protein
MKTLKVIPRSDADIDTLISLLNDTGLVQKVETSEEDTTSTKKPFRKLTVEDVALGIGRPATDEELMEYLTRPREGKPKLLKVAIKEIKEKLRKERKKTQKK